MLALKDQLADAVPCAGGLRFTSEDVIPRDAESGVPAQLDRVFFRVVHKNPSRQKRPFGAEWSLTGQTIAIKQYEASEGALGTFSLTKGPACIDCPTWFESLDPDVLLHGLMQYKVRCSR